MEASAPIELNAPSEALHPTAQPAATPEQPAAAAAAPLSAPGAAADGPTTLRVDPPSRPRAMQKTPAQKQALEDAFKANPFPDETQKKALAQELDLTDNQVSVRTSAEPFPS